MRKAGVARVERRGNERVYRADPDHRHAQLLRQLATTSADPEQGTDAGRDDQVRAWLASVGAPLASAEPEGPVPPVEGGRRGAVTRTAMPGGSRLALVLWRQRNQVTSIACSLKGPAATKAGPRPTS
jgi:hypothetical protein